MGKLQTTKEAARFLGVREAFLELDRRAGIETSSVRVGSRAIRYELAAPEALIQPRVRKST